jgi:hypothetical protein
MAGQVMITLSNGMEIFFRQDPRFGYWKLHLNAGNLPPALTGVYMSYGDAYRAVKAHYDSKKYKPKVVENGKTSRKRSPEQLGAGTDN